MSRRYIATEDPDCQTLETTVYGANAYELLRAANLAAKQFLGNLPGAIIAMAPLPARPDFTEHTGGGRPIPTRYVQHWTITVKLEALSA